MPADAEVTLVSNTVRLSVVKDSLILDVLDYYLCPQKEIELIDI